MSVYIENIGNQKISYKNADEIDFSDLSEYLLMAKKSISSFANRFYHGLAPQMLQDEDAVSQIAYSLMLADWRYDENYKGKRTSQKTRYSYRNQCALWAIQTYVTKTSKKKHKNKVFSLDYNADGEQNNDNAYRYILDKKAVNPSEELENKEQSSVLSEKINKLLDTNGVSETQKEYIRLYYMENYTYAQIGKKFSLTREAIRQSIIKAMKTIQSKNNEADYV